MLEGLPADLVIQTLRSSPVTFEDTLIQLPSALRALAMLTQCPGLDTACSPAPDITTADDESYDRPVVTVCVDTSHAKGVSKLDRIGAGGPCADSHAVARSALWLHGSQLSTANLGTGMFACAQHRGTIACRLLARSRTFRGLTIALPASAVLVFGPGCGDMHLNDVQFQGESQFWACGILFE